MELPARVRRLAGVGSRFLVVGGLSTLIEIGVFNLCIYVWGIDVVSAKIIASLVALVNAYFGNREWAFRGRDRRGRGQEVALFVAVNIVCTILGAALVWAGVELIRWLGEAEPGAVAVNLVNLVSIGVVVVLRFVLYHGLVFRVRPPAED